MAIVKLCALDYYRNNRQILKNINLSAKEGKITAIIGPSGVGKTTILQLISGQLSPTSGAAYIDDQDLNSISKSKLYAIRRKMGMLFQSGALFTDINVYENVAFPLRECTKLKETEIREIVMEKLEKVGLKPNYNMMVSELSGGMIKRVAFARAIVLEPDILMYDEPFSGLDPISSVMISSLIKKITYEKNITSIMVSHDIARVFQLCDYVYLISDGEIIEENEPDKMINSKNPITMQFMCELKLSNE